MKTSMSRRALIKTATATWAGVATASEGVAAASTRSSALRSRSPDGLIEVSIFPASQSWEVRYRGKPVIERSGFAVLLADGRLGDDARIVSTSSRKTHGRWRPPFGIRKASSEACGEIACTFADARRGITFTAIARAYDAGAAFRLRIDHAPGGAITVFGEHTEVRLPVDAVLQVSRDEGEYQTALQTGIAPVPHPTLNSSTDQGALADVPVLAQLPDGTSLVISESDRLHYPRTMFVSTAQGMRTQLMRFPGRAKGFSLPGETDPELSFQMKVGSSTPWRLAVISPDPKGLLERQDLVPTLATPNRLGNTSWIKPGRAMRIAKRNTQAGLDTVDFAAQRKLEYVEWDAGWYGDGTDPSDATYSIPAIDIRHVIDYARSKGIGMILYVDRIPAMRQLDAILRTYREWGVAGIKFGFIWEGRQSDTDFIVKIVEACGKHQLLVNLHDNLRPAGLERTYPNYISLEGVRGNENFPTATHNCTLPFARGISGPIDYTICFDSRRNRTTNAHQLALAVVYYSPLTFLYWYDTPDKYREKSWPELAFFDACPTTWDETIALSGAVGQHVVVARRTQGRWFVGAITNEKSREIKVILAFLGSGSWRARRFADGVPGEESNGTPVVISDDLVTAADVLTLGLAPSGGQAIIFEKVVR
jgi:alpha-glucosidase